MALFMAYSAMIRNDFDAKPFARKISLKVKSPALFSAGVMWFMCLLTYRLVVCRKVEIKSQCYILQRLNKQVKSAFGGYQVK